MGIGTLRTGVRSPEAGCPAPGMLPSSRSIQRVAWSPLGSDRYVSVVSPGHYGDSLSALAVARQWESFQVRQSSLQMDVPFLMVGLIGMPGLAVVSALMLDRGNWPSAVVVISGLGTMFIPEAGYGMTFASGLYAKFGFRQVEGMPVGACISGSMRRWPLSR